MTVLASSGSVPLDAIHYRVRNTDDGQAVANELVGINSEWDSDVRFIDET
jgi:hypothetical protein